MVENESGVRQLALDAISVGDRWSERVCFDARMVQAFSAVSGDSAPHHLDDEAARKIGFDGAIVHGLFLGARFSRLLGMFLPGPAAVIHSFAMDFLRPVPIGTCVDVSVIVSKVHAAVRSVQLDLS